VGGQISFMFKHFCRGRDRMVIGYTTTEM